MGPQRMPLMAMLLSLGLLACRSEMPVDLMDAYNELPEKIDFNFHIKPILSDRCYSCHGPDDNTREANLRLDQERSAFGRLEDGGQAIVTKDLKNSVAWKRIISEDPELMMPPPEAHLALTLKEKAMIGRWIEQGAEWKNHWAFIPPRKVTPPDSDSSWPINEIDQFILAEMTSLGLEPSSMVEKERLLRRVTMDLTGLPPTLQEIDAFIADKSPEAYEHVVDRLLSDIAHAERLALEWMDVARYADTHGIHADGLRIMWPWRDWVIKAFHENMSYDQFVTWQLAGDLYPNATREQKLATGFHRNHVANTESGIVPEEFRLQYVADRTNTTATAIMGLTAECAACHDHKFDPISQKEYYQMSAFFNNVHELGMLGTDQNFGPTVLLPGPETELVLSALDAKIEELEQSVQEHQPDVDALKMYLETLDLDRIPLPKPDGYFPLDKLTPHAKRNGSLLDRNPRSIVYGDADLVEGKIGHAIRIDTDYEVLRFSGVKHFEIYEGFSGGAWINVDELGTFQTIMGNIGSKNDSWRGWIFYIDTIGRPAVSIVHSLSHNYIQLVAQERIDPLVWHQLFFTYDGSTHASGVQIYLDGRKLNLDVHFDRLYKNIQPAKNRNYTPDPKRSMRMGRGSQYLFSHKDDGVLVGAIDQVRTYHQWLSPLEVRKLYQIDQGAKLQLPSNESDVLLHFKNRLDHSYQDMHASLQSLRTERLSAIDTVLESMVLSEMKHPRKTHVLNRGQYDDLGEVVDAQVPNAIPPSFEGFGKNRLGLAQWLFHPDHPLTARVAVNRYWQMLFGRGLVETTHDFGSQGALPTHPRLLDWLAVSFIDDGWDLRKLLKMMVMSASYRQSADRSEHQLSIDPNNLFLSSGPSYRWPAEIIRDNALAASDLLNPKVGGRSVKPYQPPDLWKDLNEFSGYLNTYQQDTGQELYRRSLYTFIRRTSPPPAMTTFDAPNRALCVVKRERTNTPLQALVLMNDPQLVEAARVIAIHMQQKGGLQLADQLQYAFRRLTGRSATPAELVILTNQYEESTRRFLSDPDAATKLLEVGDYPHDDAFDQTNTAALTVVANAIMNFDETYMKR
ncbi:MAG: DUF1553 domain-containing protein [Saprospiraceae bacterium]|nr:DUF1553 domain-containing protein [Saprospiraceae bacterium]